MGLHDAERALFDLRQGRPLYVTAAGEPGALIATVDGLAEPALETLRGAGPLRLAVTLHRATSMGLVPDAAADGVRGVSLSLNGEGPEQILHLAIARGRFSMDPRDVRRATTAEVGGLTLARLGRLLPRWSARRPCPTGPRRCATRSQAAPLCRWRAHRSMS